MAGSSSSSASVLDSEQFAETFIEQASAQRLRRKDAEEDLRWEWPISSLSTSSETHRSPSDDTFDDLYALDYSPEKSAGTQVPTLQSRNPSPEPHSPSERFDANQLLVETPDLQRSSRPDSPSSGPGTVFDLGSPRPWSPFHPPPSGGYSSEVSPIAIWDSDLVSDGAQTPSSVEPFPEYIDMMSPPYTDDFTTLGDTSLLASSASDNIRIWDSDLRSATQSLASRSSNMSEINSAISLGGFSFQEEAPSMESCSFVEDDEASLYSPHSVRSPGSVFSPDSVLSPATSGRYMEGLSFDDEYWVQDSIAEMEEQYAQSIEHENKEELPVLLPSPPLWTPSQPYTPFIDFSLPDSPVMDTLELLEGVCARLAGLVDPDTGVSSPIIELASNPAVAPPKSQRPKLALVTDFSIPYPVCAYPERKPTKTEQKQKQQRPASPPPQAISESLVSFYCPDTAESSQISRKQRTRFAKEIYPRPEPQPEEAEQPAPDLTPTQSQAVEQESIHVDFADTPLPTSEKKKKVAFTKPSRRQKLVHAAAEHFPYPKTGNPLRAWLRGLSAPKEEKSTKEEKSKKNRQSSVVHPLLKQPDQERLKSRAQIQVNSAIAMGKMAVAGLFTAGLYFALQRATGWREVENSCW